MKVQAKLGALFVFAAVSCLAPQGANTALAKGKSKDMGRVAVVIHDDGIDVFYHREKASSWGVAVGGLVGGLIATTASSAESKDAALRQELKDTLGGWNSNDAFREALIGNMSFDAAKVVVASQAWAFKKVEREFYIHGNSRYNKNELVYDYTPLAAEGINTVMDVSLQGLLANSGAKRLQPILTAKATYIDLDTKTAFSQKSATVTSKGNEPRKELAEFTANSGAHAKKCFSELVPKAAAKLGKKLK